MGLRALARRLYRFPGPTLNTASDANLGRFARYQRRYSHGFQGFSHTPQVSRLVVNDDQFDGVSHAG